MTVRLSPPIVSPQIIGAIADVTAVTGERMLIGPIARQAYRSAIAVTPNTPESAPQATSSMFHRAPSRGISMNRTTRPLRAAVAVTTIERKRLAARPPKKSAAP